MRIVEVTETKTYLDLLLLRMSRKIWLTVISIMVKCMFLMMTE